MEDNNYLKKELYELVKKDESIFDFIQENSLDGLWYLDLENQEEEWMNPKFWSVLGYDHKEMPHKSSAWLNLINQEDLVLATENFNKHCENANHAYDQTVRYTHKNGSTVWIRCRGIAIRDKNGKAVRMLGTHHDITKLKERELQLQKNTAQLRKAQKISKTGSWELDLKTNEVVWSEELYKMYGLDPTLPAPSYPEQIKLYTPESWEALTSSVSLAVEQGIPYELELAIIRKDASQVWIWARGEAAFDENRNIIGLRGIAQDITERKIVELEKEELTKRLNYALDASGDGIWDWNPISNEVTFSKAWMEMLGHIGDEVEPTFDTWSDKMHPEDADWVYADILKIIKSSTNGDTYNQEYRFKNKKGDYLWMLNKGKVVERNEKGEATRVVGTHTDITDRKKAEEKLRRMSTLLNDAQRIAKMGGWEVEIETGETFWTDGVYDIYEVEKDFQHNKVKGIEFYHPDYRPVISKAIADTTEKQIPFDVKCKFITAKNNVIWIRSTGYPVIEDGKVVRIYGMTQDITQLEADKEAIIREQMFSKQLLENMADGFSVIDLEGQQIVVNKAFCEMTGFSEDELIGQTAPYPYWPEEEIEKINNEFQNTLNEELGSFELILKRKNGERFPVMISTGVLKDEYGNTINYFANIKDITEQKRIDLVLKESEKKFRELFENLIDEVHLWKIIKGENEEITGWQLVDANPAALKSWGKSINDVIGKSPNEIFGTDAHSQFMPIVEKIFATGKPYRWEEYFPPTDQYLYMESIPFDDKFISTGKDITQQKKSEKALKESELRLSLATQAGGVGVWDWDIEENILTWDDQMFALYSTKREDFSNAYEAWVQGVHEEDKETSNNEIELAIKGEKEFNTEFRVQHPNGEIKNIRALAKVIRDHDGNALRMIGTNWDISKEKEALKQIEEAKEHAEKASKAKSEFLANMSHELRTPLNSVIGFTDLLKDTKLSSVQQQYINNANVSGHALLHIINDILDFSKIEAGMLDLEIIKTDILELFENSLDIIKIDAIEKDLEFLLDIDPAMPRFANVDPIRLKQILSNLLSNAVKFTPNGEVELNVSYKALEGDQGKLIISIRDTGIGISDNQKEKLFKVFSQADSSTTRKYGGTGLGLVISEMIAEKMDSKIKIDNTSDVGTTFYFDITTEFEEEEHFDFTKISDVKKCLVIDNNPKNLMIIKRMLDQLQIKSDCFENGFEALKKMEISNDYDVIICDYEMPYINGIDTIRMMKDKLDIDTEIQPVILLHSSLDIRELEQETKQIGVSYLLNKPLKSIDLFSFLCNLNQGSKTSKQNQEIETEKVPKASFSTKKIKIIIAEDDSLNMLLGKTLLLRIMPNCEIYEAKNGLEAINKYKSTNPNLIFMDVQMPELDGIEATKQIREIESHTGSHTPIIALTAGALKEEKDKCLSAGMDVFLTKPLEPQKINEVLNKYLIEDKTSTIELQSQNFELEKHFGYGELLKNLDNNTEIIKNLMSITLKDMPVKIKNLEQAYDKKDKTQISEIAHSIKGAALSMRCKLLGELAEEIENNSHKNDEVLLSKLKGEWKIVKGIILEKMK